MSEKHVDLWSRAYRPGGLVVYRQRTMDPAGECVSIGIRRSMPSPHRWHGDVPRVQHEPVASTEAGHQRQLSKWLVGCAGFYHRGHAKRERPHHWMRELPVPPLYFASAVLPDGRVVVIGGEYNSGAPVWTNIGFMYDPVANTWSAQITVPGTWCCAGGGGTGAIGDAQSTILTNGTMLVANIGNRDIASFNPATLTFSALAPTDKDDINDEEGWNQLANGTFLTVDSRIQASFEIYDSATNSWGTAGSTVVNLADTGAGTVNSKEVGPAVLRPDGTLIAFSGTNSGQNAVYNTATGTWAATGVAGDFPAGPGASHFAVADGPACLLPNGNVLVMASPVYPTNPPGVFNPPSHFFEFDGTNLTQVADSPNAASFISYQGRMLLLPSGEVLLTAYNQGGNQLLHPNARTNRPIKTPSVPLVDVADVTLYSNGGMPQDIWRPVITTAPSTVLPGNTYAISGTLFNGFSEGASYGDDAQMSTNYPLVRIRNHATGHVLYARTHNHSRMGVEAVGSSEIVTTQFDVPASVEAGASDLVVVANGIPSFPADTVVQETATPTPTATPTATATATPTATANSNSNSNSQLRHRLPPLRRLRQRQRQQQQQRLLQPHQQRQLHQQSTPRPTPTPRPVSTPRPRPTPPPRP